MLRTYDNSVFINCPFDSTYRPLFEAATFAAYDCGFFPRSALELEDSSQVRIQKIEQIIRESRLAIHDISRTQLDPQTQLPRFNMPLELGIFLGAKAFGSGDQRRKAAVVLDQEPYRYQKFISDIAGHDIHAHGGNWREVIFRVRDFLAAQSAGRKILPGGAMVVNRYIQFRCDLTESCCELHLDPASLTFRDLTNFIVGWLESHPLPTA
ncbi:MAG TPA: hypothetical protein VJT67_06030 [Longimicrobiaceae bacterium]|nr:hypothetical protein [Longimicrobiaceae bacterium]